MPRTRDAHKAGKTDAVAIVRYRIPLADPHACGNMGLEGHDEDSRSRVAPNAGLARHAAVKLAKQILREPPPDALRWPDGRAPFIDHLTVIVRRWDAEEFDDPGYGHIYDAIPAELSEQYGYLADDGSVAWDEPEPTS